MASSCSGSLLRYMVVGIVEAKNSDFIDSYLYLLRKKREKPILAWHERVRINQKLHQTAPTYCTCYVVQCATIHVGKAKHASDYTSVSFNLSLDFSWALSSRTGSIQNPGTTVLGLGTARHVGSHGIWPTSSWFPSCMALVWSWGLANKCSVAFTIHVQDSWHIAFKLCNVYRLMQCWMATDLLVCLYSVECM